jgi:hypothetical protein
MVLFYNIGPWWLDLGSFGLNLSLICSCLKQIYKRWRYRLRHDIQQNDTRHNDTQHTRIKLNDNQYNDAQYKDTGHNDVQRNNK